MITVDSELLFASLGAHDLADTSDFIECFRAWRPHPKVRLLAWSIHNVANDQGRPYDDAAYPHLGAPGGPLDALDDPKVRTVALQFATRLGKSFIGQVALLYYADCDPCPMLIASESERSLKRIMQRNYAMVYARPQLQRKLLHRSTRDHKQDHMVFRECHIRGGWARSAGTIADMNIKVGFANELDKDGWDSKTTTKEGAPEKLFDDRFKDYQSVRKVIYESTPTVRGRSRIERRRLIGTNCDFWVPCPHCGVYQVLRMGKFLSMGQFDWGENGRLEWDLAPGGKHDRDLARNTARYVCVNGCVCRNEFRAWMMRRGVWAPEGCEIDSEQALAAVLRWQRDQKAESAPVWEGWSASPWITSRPVRDGPDASYRLSSLYALALGWGDIAAEWVDSRGNPQIMRNFVNQWLSETWESAESRTTWELLGKKIINNDLPRLTAPDYASVVTCGIDCQRDRYVWVLIAWGPSRRHAVVGYGEDEDLEQIVQEILLKPVPHADGGPPIKCSLAIVDSGYRPAGVYEACAHSLKAGIQLWPCKGSRQTLESDFRQTRLGENTSMPGMILWWVDTSRTQCWLDNILHVLNPGDPGCVELHAGSLGEHQDYLTQLLNDAPVYKLDATNHERENWHRIDPRTPNDYRDCQRYAYAAMVIATRNRQIAARNQPEQSHKLIHGSISAEKPAYRRWS